MFIVSNKKKLEIYELRHKILKSCNMSRNKGTWVRVHREKMLIFSYICVKVPKTVVLLGLKREKHYGVLDKRVGVAVGFKVPVWWSRSI